MSVTTGRSMRELRPTLLAFAHFFLIISSYYIIKPVRDALFVKTIGPDRMPYLVGLVSAGYWLVVVLMAEDPTRSTAAATR